MLNQGTVQTLVSLGSFPGLWYRELLCLYQPCLASPGSTQLAAFCSSTWVLCPTFRKPQLCNTHLLWGAFMHSAAHPQHESCICALGQSLPNPPLPSL